MRTQNFNQYSAYSSGKNYLHILYSSSLAKTVEIIFPIANNIFLKVKMKTTGQILFHPSPSQMRLQKISKLS